MNGSTPTNVTTPPGGVGCNNNNNNNVIGGGNGSSGGNVGRVTSLRRPQQQQLQQQHSSSSIDQKLLSLTIHKDSNGYGMKVSGDNPVFVESVKNGGAAQKAGLIAGDMILKVNGEEVRSEKHPTVVSLIKSHTVVELTVRRSLKMQRPTSVGIGPGTPILPRDRATSITGPQPVDNDKRRELEFHKIKTLQLMLEQERKNLENIKTYNNSASNRQDRARAEANIRQLQEQLRQVGGEDSITLHILSTTSPNTPNTLITPPSHHGGGGGLFHHITPQNSSPAFLSRFPRSLSSLSLGTRKQKEKDLITSPINQTIISPSDFLATQNIINNTKSTGGNTTPLSTSYSMSQSMFQKYQQHKQQHHATQQQNLLNTTPTKKKFIGGKDDMPPPLPQRNPPRNNIIDNSQNIDLRSRNIPISDLDLTMQAATGVVQNTKRFSPNSNATNNNNNAISLSGGGGKSGSSGKKRPKSKTKALSDPKMSTQLFLQMEKGESCNEDNNMIDILIPPPLPPRQPGMMEENQNLANTNKLNNNGSSNTGRLIPNSVETLMNYPLISTCTAVRDNLLNNQQQPTSKQQRTNIVQQYQQHQQNLQQQQQQHFHNQHHLNKTPSTQNSAITTSKSTALGQTPQNHFNKHRRVVSSPENMHPKHEKQLDRHNKSSSGSWDLLEKDNEMTPPETPPPPYQSSQNLMSQSQILHGSYQLTSQGSEETDNIFLDNSNNSGGGGGVYPNQILAAQANTIQKKIISMEDEEVSDQECIVDEHGPFNHLQRLLEQENIVHLAVFLNYVLSNSDPAPLLFYLITGLYKEGTVKDMRKWAYEIHSTFLVPLAPLMWFTADESLAREVDNVLQNEYDKVEILRKVFWKSRKKAKERIYDQLIDFQQKRTAGLGTIYGPSDSHLLDARGDKTKEQKIFEETLLKKLQYLVDEIDKDAPNEDWRKLALCSALSTVIQRIFITRSNPGSPIDRVHHFVSREKSFKRIMGKHRKIVVRGHPLTLRQYYEVTHCNHCQLIIWGVSPQGYHCTDCKLNIHRPCSKVLEESCPGPVPQKRKEPNTDNKISKFMGIIRPSHNFIQNERRMESSSMAVDDIFFLDRLNSTTSVVRHPSDRRPDLANSSISSSSVGTQSHNTSELQTSQSLDADSNALDAEQDSKTRDNRSKSKSAPVSVNRSESYKDRLTQKRLRSNRRKTSDPSLTKTNDEQQSELGLSNSNYTASSSSSLSSGGSLESPSTSLEQVGGIGSASGTPVGYNQHHHNHSSHHQQQHSHHHGGTPTPIGPMTTATGTVLTPRLWVDSDDEDNFNEVDWSSNIQTEILASLSDTEKKRQEIINEIFQTERSHVRTLRVLEGIFYRPLKETSVLSSDHLQLLFPPALLSLKELHLTFEQKLKARRIEHNHIVENVGDLLITMFEGISGDELRDNAMQFCARQQIALEALKEKRRKDENLQRFLTKAESHKACRRLQLKDLLPTVLQRLTKYPLLFENLLKITIRVNPDDKLEADTIQRALYSSKRILVDVNQAVKIAEDTHKLQTIQRKLDKSSFDKESSNEFKNLDLTQYKLVHDGQLTMKKSPGVQLHGLLFENMMVLVQKQDDKYFLKYFPNVAAGTNENNKMISPITHFDQQTFVRQSAVDKNTFFVIITKTSQMLELRAPSSSECKTWFKHISEAAEQYKPRSKNNQDVVEDPASTTLPHSNTKESLEGTPERTNISTTIQSTERSSTPLHNNYIKSTSNLSGQSGQQKQDNNLVNDNNNSIIDEEKSNPIDDCVNYNDEQSHNIEKLSNNGGGISNASVGQQQQNSDRRDSIYSNNSNNTRTLMQHCPLLEPSEIQISISPAHTAEPIVTPAEQLRRLDEKIRNDLAEKQKIICDMFRVPNEHFMAIADIVGQPEAPKDSSDICLAAFAQVQSLTEILTEFMKCTPEQEISAVSTVVCDQCHHINNHQRRLSSLSLTPGGASIENGGIRSLSPLQSSVASTNTDTTVIQKQYNFDQNTLTSPIKTTTAENNSSSNSNNSEIINNFNIDKSNELIDEQIIHEDDDGYCEIDELRLPSVQPTNSSVGFKQIGNNSSNNNCGGNGNPVSYSSNNNDNNSNNNQSSSPPELLKRQSTISADSIPEESEQNEETTNSIIKVLSSSNSKVKDDRDDNKDNNEQHQIYNLCKEDLNIYKTSKMSSEDDSLNSEHIEINDTYDTTGSVNKITSIGNLVYHGNNPLTECGDASINEIHHLCGPNRLAHVNTLEPSIPCHIINGFVTALNTQISLLLPKINERDLERDRLRKENQHLRELLNAMHENKRVEDEKETPENVAKSIELSSSSADSEVKVSILSTSQQPE